MSLAALLFTTLAIVDEDDRPARAPSQQTEADRRLRAVIEHHEGHGLSIAPTGMRCMACRTVMADGHRHVHNDSNLVTCGAQACLAAKWRRVRADYPEHKGTGLGFGVFNNKVKR